MSSQNLYDTVEKGVLKLASFISEALFIHKGKDLPRSQSLYVIDTFVVSLMWPQETWPLLDVSLRKSTTEVKAILS